MPLIATDPDLPPRPTGTWTTRTPEVVTPPPAVPAKTDALALFREDPAALKASALAVLDIKTKAPETPGDAAKLSNKISEAATLVKNIDARRLLIVGEIKKQTAAVDAEARTWREPVVGWIARAKTALIAYQTKAEEDAQREEEARQQAIRDAAKKKGEAEILGNTAALQATSTEIMHLEAAAPVVPVQGFKTDAGSNTIRKTWKVQVVNPAEVPPAYLVPDLARLQAAVDAHPRPWELTIEGCHIEEIKSLVTRTR